MYTTRNYNQSFWNAMRGRKEAYLEMNEGADSSTGSYLSPVEFREKFNTALAKDNLFRRLATVVRMSSSDGTIQAVASTGSAAWVPEGTAIAESSDTFAQFPVKSYKLASLSRLKESFVTDMNFDLEGYLLNEFTRRFGRAEEEAFINGDGANQPSGIIGTNSGEVGVTAASATAITYDEIIKLYFSLDTEYRQNAVFLMHDETAMLLRTLKDGNGNYLWNSSNDTIFGKPVLTSLHMPTIAPGKKTILFGDLTYYWLIERQPLSIKCLSELYRNTGQIGFSAFERVDGKLIRPEAVKVLKQAE
jgi:HK97 family phage major capsid protein